MWVDIYLFIYVIDLKGRKGKERMSVVILCLFYRFKEKERE